MEHLAYRPDIDGLRAVAVLGVVLFHAFPKLLPGGFAGVDVFFVISGYLITALIIQDFGRGGFSVWHFYARRIRRIFPALLVMLAVVWGLGYALLVPGELRMLGESLGRSAYFSNNFLLFGQAGYFDTDAELKPLLHLWSLAVEEQFYIVWPWLLWMSIRLRPAGKWIPLGLLVFSLLGCVSFGIFISCLPKVTTILGHPWQTKFRGKLTLQWPFDSGTTLTNNKRGRSDGK